MKMKKTKIATAIICLLISVSVLPVSAEGKETWVSPSIVQVEREDVSLKEALGDSTFDVNYNYENEIGVTRDASWEVWGERQYRTSDNTARPIGYSQHVSNGKVLNTYHYTRTYLDSGIGGKKGDSGRVWGSGKVKAVGGYCSMDVWDTTVHKVKYGTES